jgi:hypothetical protein
MSISPLSSDAKLALKIKGHHERRLQRRTGTAATNNIGELCALSHMFCGIEDHNHYRFLPPMR